MSVQIAGRHRQYWQYRRGAQAGFAAVLALAGAIVGIGPAIGLASASAQTITCIPTFQPGGPNDGSFGTSSGGSEVTAWIANASCATHAASVDVQIHDHLIRPVAPLPELGLAYLVRARVPGTSEQQWSVIVPGETIGLGLHVGQGQFVKVRSGLLPWSGVSNSGGVTALLGALDTLAFTDGYLRLGDANLALLTKGLESKGWNHVEQGVLGRVGKAALSLDAVVKDVKSKNWLGLIKDVPAAAAEADVWLPPILAAAGVDSVEAADISAAVASIGSDSGNLVFWGWITGDAAATFTIGQGLNGSVMETAPYRPPSAGSPPGSSPGAPQSTSTSPPASPVAYTVPTISWSGVAGQSVPVGSAAQLDWSFAYPSGASGWSQGWDAVPGNSGPWFQASDGYLSTSGLAPGTHHVVLTFYWPGGEVKSVSSPAVTVTSTTPTQTTPPPTATPPSSVSVGSSPSGLVSYVSPRIGGVNGYGWTHYNGGSLNGEGSWFAPSTTGPTTATTLYHNPMNWGAGNYEVWVYVPSGDANANPAYYGVNDAGGTAIVPVDQASVTGWVALGSFSSPNSVNLANNDGQTGTFVGVDVMAFQYLG
jgi:hypothetical protein